MSLPPFTLEAHFARWEFRAEYHLTASDAQSMTVSELLALADADDASDWDALTLGYTEVRGDPALRTAIAGTFGAVEPTDVLVFGGPGEGLTTTFRALLEPADHAVVVIPNYQSAETVPASLCDTTGVPLSADDGWELDVDAVAAALRPNTRVVAVNFPNNPTGAVPGQARWRALVDLVAERGIYLFGDEIYRGVELDPSATLPAAADLYDKAISLNGVSKAYGLPGLRVGWVVSRDRALLDRIEQGKHYGSICSSAPSEVLARVAVKSRETLFARTRAQLRANLPEFQRFFDRHGELFEYAPPRGGCVCFPRYAGPEGVEAFCHDAVHEAGVLLLPASIYRSALGPVPTDRFRVGLGRAGSTAGLVALDDFLTTRRNRRH